MTADPTGSEVTSRPEPHPSSTTLSVRGLSVDFETQRGEARVIDDVSFEVGRGETLGVVGESGSGKTVASLSVMGLLPRAGRVASGTILLNGKSLLDLSPRELENVRGADIAMIFQEPMTSLNPAYTVGDQISETVRRHLGLSRRKAAARTLDMLRRVHIPNAERRVRSYPHEFSGGMRQRVMIAMALCCDPSLLIADEPTTALDVTVQAQVLELVKEVQHDSQMSILFITHDLGVVADICDRVAVMYAGQIIEATTCKELFRSPGHPYTDGLLRSMPAMAARTGSLHSISGHPPTVGQFPSGCRFHPRCPHVISECSDGPSGGLRMNDLNAGHSARCLRTSELRLGPDVIRSEDGLPT